jgi:hypothetical protein
VMSPGRVGCGLRCVRRRRGRVRAIRRVWVRLPSRRGCGTPVVASIGSTSGGTGSGCRRRHSNRPTTHRVPSILDR